MSNGKNALAVMNMGGLGTDGKLRWTARLLSSLRPGGVWVIPRSISTVLVLSKDPPIVQVHSIFPDPGLASVLEQAGWIIQRRPTETSK